MMIILRVSVTGSPDQIAELGTDGGWYRADGLQLDEPMRVRSASRAQIQDFKRRRAEAVLDQLEKDQLRVAITPRAALAVAFKAGIEFADHGANGTVL